MKEKLRSLFTDCLVSIFLLSIVLIISTAANCGVKLCFSTVLYIIASAICHGAVLTVLPLALTLPVALLMQKSRVPDIIFAVLSAFVQIVVIIDYFVFAFYRYHINGFVWGLLTGPAAGQIFVFDFWVVFKCVVGAIIIIVANFFIIIKLNNIISNKTLKYSAFVVLFFVLFANCMHAYGAATLNSSVIKCTEAVPYYYPIRANSLLSKLGLVDSGKIQAARAGSGILNYPKAELNWNDSITPPNIIFIMIDAWNRRTFNDETTPCLRKFSEKCVYYSDHVSASNGTQGSIFTIFTSLSSYYWQDFEISSVNPVFVDRLKTLGYDFKTFPGATLRSPAFNSVLLHQFPDINTDTEGKTVYDRDCNLSADFINYLDGRDSSKPFFAWLFYDLAHSYEMPKERLWKFRPTWEFADYTLLSADMDPAPYFNLYRNAVYQADSLVGIVLQNIEKHGLLENSVIVICGDHGQEFNDNKKNFWGHNGNFSDVQIGTNLLWYSPDSEPKTVKYRTSHYDISPTVLKKYLGLQNSVEDFGSGKMLTDSTLRDWLLVGSRDNFAFLHKNHIYEKRPSGYFFATDAFLNELPQDSIDYNVLNEKIREIGSFYK
jgi:hypothetical protein